MFTLCECIQKMFSYYSFSDRLFRNFLYFQYINSAQIWTQKLSLVLKYTLGKGQHHNNNLLSPEMLRIFIANILPTYTAVVPRKHTTDEPGKRSLRWRSPKEILLYIFRYREFLWYCQMELLEMYIKNCLLTITASSLGVMAVRRYHK